MAASSKLHVTELETQVRDLKTDRIGYSRSLTNLRNRTRLLLDYLEEYVEPKLKTRALSELKKHTESVGKLVR